MGLLSDYSLQAERYDQTRAASASILRGLRQALLGAPGRRLADIGGGTGNYALALQREGWQPTVVDRSPAMLTRAAAKGLLTVEAEAEHLPFGDQSFDAAMLVSMLHHVDDQFAALAEARRILRAAGHLVLIVYTREDTASLWILDYFPSSRDWMESTHPPTAVLLEALPGAQVVTLEYTDLQDASLAALSADPPRLLKAADNGETSYFERMRRDHLDELHSGLARLHSDIAGGRSEWRAGTVTLLSWKKPLAGQSRPTTFYPE
jgi:SAM-dependent methyltransferase